MMSTAMRTMRMTAVPMRPVRRGRQPDVIPGANVIGIPLAILAAVKMGHAIRFRRIELGIGAQKPVERDAIPLGDTPKRIAALCRDGVIIIALRIPHLRCLAIRFGIADALLKVGG